jgi:Uma2 family endonuclease
VSRGRRSWQRDYQIKRDEYRSAGVREYWVIDRFERRMTVFRFAQEKTTTKTVGQRQTYTTKLLPGFELPLASLLELMDRWGDSTA